MSLRFSEKEAKAMGILSKKDTQRTKKNESLIALVKQGSDPEAILVAACASKWPHCIPEFNAGVPGRKFRIDIAFKQAKLGVEVDGWSSHGRTLSGFKKDKARQNLLVVHGWRILRFTNDDVKNHLPETLSMIELALNTPIKA